MVSVIVVTYNSEKFILETLESVKEQSYRELEIIIADDSSKDKTVEKVEKWIEKNRENFNNIVLLKNKVNIGISKNIQRALEKCKGEYIKVIAGDDLLKSNCILDNYNFAKSNGSDFVFSNGDKFKVVNSKKIYIEELISKKKKGFFKLPNEEKLIKLSTETFMYAPTAFIRRKVLLEMGGFVTKYRMLEDTPTWIKAIKLNKKIDYLDIKTVEYRIHENSISNSELRREVYNVEIVKSLEDIYITDLKSLLIKKRLFFIIWYINSVYYVQNKIIERGNKKENYTLELKLIKNLNPYAIYRRIKRLS